MKISGKFILKVAGTLTVISLVVAALLGVVAAVYVTGTSDALNTEFIMDMMFAQNPDVAKVGLLYSLSEPNSTKPIADAKAYLDAKGIEYVEQTANTNDGGVGEVGGLGAEVGVVHAAGGVSAVADEGVRAGVVGYSGVGEQLAGGGGLEHLVKAHAAQGGFKLAHGKVAVFFVKGLAYTCAYGRGDLSDYARITIRKVFP